MTDSEIIRDAIASKRCIELTYNNMRLKVAPHILYTRHDAPFMDGVPVEREGKELNDPRLATFKLAGLREVAVIDRSFEPMAGFDASDQKYSESPPSSVG